MWVARNPGTVRRGVGAAGLRVATAIRPPSPRSSAEVANRSRRPSRARAFSSKRPGERPLTVVVRAIWSKSVRSKRLLPLTIAVVCVDLVLAVLATDAPAANSIRPAPGTPDPRQMVLTSADLGRAKVTSQGYYKDHELPSVISYRREFEDARAGSIELLEVDSEAEVGTSVLSSARALTTVKRPRERSSARLSSHWKRIFRRAALSPSRSGSSAVFA
jgi:hypothetical protein